MKKILLTVVIAFLCLSAMLCFASCNDAVTESICYHYATNPILGKKATCTEDGATAAIKCGICNEILEDSKVIPALGHEEVIINGKPATDTETGLSDGKKCNRCGEILEEQIRLPIGTRGLTYELSADGTYYIVTGLEDEDNTSLSIPAKYKNLPVKAISPYAFENCKEIERVNIPKGIVSIGVGAFSGCEKLTYISIPEGVTCIYADTFLNCKSLERVGISFTVSYIDRYAFKGCNKITEFQMSRNNYMFKSIDGNLYSHDGTVLLKYASGKDNTSFTVPDGTVSIESEAFADCSNLKTVTISDSVVNIGANAFRSCEKLTSIIFKNKSGWKCNGEAIDVTKSYENAEALMQASDGSASWKRGN